ncbi:MAG TPA: Gfo/Idh/MocA family oxidoreductase [Clostridia bacterium]|nr:Gfo/Idh/MocA family oxidoreductase [Clostridia bacterium]
MEYKLGIIGYGGMGSWHHKNSVKVPGLRVTSAFDIDQQRLKIAAENGLKTYDNVDEFLKNGDFSIVLVATPNNFHKYYSVMAMDAKKHVVCEKPVAMNLAELDDMIAASKKNNVLFTVHQNRRWDKDYKTVKKVLSDNLIGKPYTIESRVHGQNGVMHGWRAYQVAGGGMLFDWGVHLIDQMLYMVNEKVTEVYCQLFSIKTPEVDDYFKLILRFESGLSAQIEVGTYCLEKMPRWYVNADQGSVLVKNWECEGKVTRASQIVMEWEPEIVQTVGGPTRTMAPRPKETLEEIDLPKVQSEWVEYYMNIIAYLNGKEDIIVKQEELRRVMQVIEAAFESDKSHQSIKCLI